MRKTTLLGALLVSVAMLFPATAHAQRYVQQVWDQLQATYTVATENGSYSLHNYIMGRMNNGSTDSWTFTFDQGRSYLITGACDTDCSDLDITIKNASGTVIAQDAQADDVPVVRFTAPASGRYTVEVKMFKCTGNPCYFGFGMFAR